MVTTLMAVWSMGLQAPTVTYHGPADRLEVVLAAVGKQLGENLQPTPQLADVPVLLRCDNQPAAEVYKHLAALVNGRWERDKTAYRLIRDARDIAAEEREDQRLNTEKIAKFIQKRKDEVAKMEPFDETQAQNLVKQIILLGKEFDPKRQDSKWYERTNALDQQGPGSRAIKRIIANLDPALLASLPPKVKVVFSDKPNPSQYPLPKGVQQSIAMAIREQNQFADVAQKRDLKPSNFNGGDYYFMPLMQHRDPIGTASRVWLSIFTNPGEQAQLELKLLNAKGVPVIDASDYMSFQGMGEEEGKWWADTPAKAGEKVIKIDDARKPLVDSLTFDPEKLAGGLEQLPALSELGRKLALNVDTIEPVTYLMTDILDQAIPDGPLTAIVEDQTLIFGLIRKNGWTVDAARKLLGSLNNLTVADGWSQLRPTMMGKYLQEKIGRSWQAKIIRTTASKSSLTIEEQAQIAFLMGDKEVDYLTMFFGQRLSPQPEGLMTGNTPYYRLYGSLTASQRQQAFKNGCPISSLGKPQTKIISRILYGQYVNINYGNEEGEAPSEAENFDWDSFYQGVGREPTEIFPNGIPGDGMVKLKETSDEIVTSVRDPGVTTWYGDQNADEFASQMFYRTRPDIFTWITANEKPPTKFRYAKRRQVVVDLLLKPKLKISETLTEKQFTTSSPVAYSGLPADFRAKVEAVMAKMKEQYKDAKPGQYGSAPARGGSTIPPR